MFSQVCSLPLFHCFTGTRRTKYHTTGSASTLPEVLFLILGELVFVRVCERYTTAMVTPFSMLLYLLLYSLMACRSLSQCIVSLAAVLSCLWQAVESDYYPVYGYGSSVLYNG